MSEAIGMITDPDFRKVAVSAEKQGFVLHRRSTHGVAVYKDGIYVCTISRGATDMRAIRNTKAALKRAGWDEHWVAPKEETTAYTKERIDTMVERMEMEEEQAEVENNIPWLQGPKIKRAAVFLSHHPDRRFTYRYLADRCGVPYMTVASNVKQIIGFSTNIVKIQATLLWDSLLIPDQMLRLERALAEARSRGEMAPPVFQRYSEDPWDRYGRLQLTDSEGEKWIAVPLHFYDR